MRNVQNCIISNKKLFNVMLLRIFLMQLLSMHHLSFHEPSDVSQKLLVEVQGMSRFCCDFSSYLCVPSHSCHHFPLCKKGCYTNAYIHRFTQICYMIYCITTVNAFVDISLVILMRTCFVKTHWCKLVFYTL